MQRNDPQRANRGAVHISSDDVRERDITHDIGVEEARRRFGGIDVPATVAGTLCALGLTVLLAGLAGGAGSVGYRRGVDSEDLSVGGLLAGFAILLIAFFVGGWVAGRMARYDGLKNGLLTALWFVLLAAAVSALGTWADDQYDFFQDVRLPQWFSDADSSTAVITTLVGIAIMFVAAAAGGGIGARYHREPDALIAHTREGGIVRSDLGEARVERSTRHRRVER